MSLCRAFVIVLVATLTVHGFASADGLTKESAAKQYAQRDLARQNSGETELVGPSLNVITIELSKTCYQAVKENNTTKCPSYGTLRQYDTSDQRYLGKFITKNGMLVRDKPAIKNPSLTLWDLKETLVCVDCPWDVYKNSKHIIISGDPFVYINPNDRSLNNTRYEYHNRFVDNCANAKVYWQPWLVNDTINYLKSGCTQTGYNATKMIYSTPIKHDIKTTKAYKYAQWLKEAKTHSKENCVKSTTC